MKKALALPFETRRAQYQRLTKKHFDKVPVLFFKHEKDLELPQLDKSKFLLASSLTFGNVQAMIRKQLKLKDHQALFFFVDNTLPAASQLLSQVYKEHQNTDGFLYVEYSAESTFG